MEHFCSVAKNVSGASAMEKQYEMGCRNRTGIKVLPLHVVNPISLPDKAYDLLSTAKRDL